MALEDKTEAPTPKKRQDAREEGQVAKSQEINAAFILLAGLYILKYVGPGLFQALHTITVKSFTELPVDGITPSEVQIMLARILLQVGKALVPILLGLMLVGAIANVAQVGLKLSAKALRFKPDRLNPLPGIARMFSTSAAVDLLKSVAKVTVVAFVVVSFLIGKWDEIACLAGTEFKSAYAKIGEIAFQVFTRGALAILVIAILDYIYQRYQHEKKIKMSKQEVKDESKQQDGDPQIKGAIRRRQMEASRRRMMSEVPDADVVVTNPTHYAVALKYDADTYDAPIVVAKGQRLIAQKIKEIAMENNIPVVENVSLARTLFASVEIGEEIPADLYGAVAEVLAYVYRLSNKVAA